MAASSPVLSNNGGETTPTTTTTNFTPPPPPSPATVSAKSPALPTVTLQRSDPSKNLRGLNKPKCIKCGNVARSRCPYQSCKSCCSKAQNPCHIHVLKPNATLADRGASANTTTQQQQQPNEVPSSGPPTKVSSLRQLSSTFAQFNNVHIPLRSRKPVTKKEALAINAWRFAKLKEYKERNIEAEHEAFDRYMQNISLLEETFKVNSKSPDNNNIPLLSNSPTTSGDETGMMISEMKVKLRSDPARMDKFRKRIHQAVDQGLRKLQKHDPIETANNLIELDSTPNAAENWTRKKKTLSLIELNERLNKARNEEDLKLCMEMRSKIRGERNTNFGEKTESAEVAKEKGVSGNLSSAQDPDYTSLLKLVRTSEIDQDALNSIESHFSSLEEIEDL